MKHITDEMVDALLDAEDAQRALTEAFRSFGEGRAAMQPRVRTQAGGIKLSTLGAVIPDQGVAGAKVYTTIEGQFSFVILLFSTVDGRPLASFNAAAITRLRTAACSVIASRNLARPDSRRLALFGLGTQGRAHATQMASAWPLEEIRVWDQHSSDAAAQQLARACGVAVRRCSAAAALDGADIVVTATRARTPLFAGDEVSPGTFIAAVGSSLPDTRELDDATLARASVVAVDWKPQTSTEAGDIVLADPAALPPAKIVELADLATGRATGRGGAQEVTIYKAVGVGLQDIALAGLAWQRFGQQ
ncbi:MAG TPA: ornithine cyclodeaminase family protein [Ramlibacter sp.]|nr:ornithine cyclodeaminase family protein [Ramlibacter sp.]